MKKNRISICGRNTITAPVPLITPSVRRLRRKPPGSAVWTHLPIVSNSAVIASIGACAQANTAWNITNRMTAISSGPPTGCSATASIRWLQRRAPCSSRVAAIAIARARRWSTTISSWITPGPAAMRRTPPSPIRLSIAALSSSMPRLRTATVGITGTPSSAESLAASIVSPSRSAMSIMLSATTTGSPSRISCSAKRRWLSRLVASTTIRIACGRRSPSCRPNSTSRVTCSSGLAGSSE